MPEQPSDRRASFEEAFAHSFGAVAGFVAMLGIIGVIVGIIIYVVSEFGSNIATWIAQFTLNDLLAYLVSWILLLVISLAAGWHISEIMTSLEANRPKRRALSIAFIIGLVLIVILFKQPYLDMLFANQGAENLIGPIAFSSGAVSGWLVWYLKAVKRYGDFFYVLLLTVTIGLCWYARLTAPEPIQITAVAFVLGSLFKIAKDYMDAEAEKQDAHPIHAVEASGTGRGDDTPPAA